MRMAHSFSLHPVHAGLGLSLVLIGLVFTLLPGVGAAASVLPYTVVAESRDDQVGTGTNDLSGVTFNESRNRVLVVDNATNEIHEFDLGPDGSLVIGPRRTIDVGVGGGDLEGIAWIEGDDYAVLSENTGVVEIVTIPDDVGVTAIDAADRSASFDTFITEDASGFGAEGIAHDRNESNGVKVFWVTREKDPTLFRVDSLGNQLAIVPVPVLDASGVYVSPDDDTVFVVSDESQEIVQLSIDVALGEATVLSRMALPEFEQAEGITFNADMSSLFVFGESPTDGWTYARYQGPTIPATATPTPSPTPTATATATPTPTATATPTPTATATPTPTATPTARLRPPSTPAPPENSQPMER